MIRLRHVLRSTASPLCRGCGRLFCFFFSFWTRFWGWSCWGLKLLRFEVVEQMNKKSGPFELALLYSPLLEWDVLESSWLISESVLSPLFPHSFYRIFQVFYCSVFFSSFINTPYNDRPRTKDVQWGYSLEREVPIPGRRYFCLPETLVLIVRYEVLHYLVLKWILVDGTVNNSHWEFSDNTASRHSFHKNVMLLFLVIQCLFKP